MNELKSQIKKLSERLEQALLILKLEKERAQLIELEKSSANSGFWLDQSLAQETMKKLSIIKGHLAKWDGLTKEINDLAILIENTSDHEHALIRELELNLRDVTSRFEKTEFELLFSGEDDSHNAILSISAGSGGTDAQDWAEMLLRMYLRFAEKQAFQAEVMDQTKGEEAGIKSVTVKITGLFAFGYLKSEFGVHRLVRLSPYDADNARHTSFALVEVLPEIEKDEFVLDDKDLRIDVFRSGGHGGQSVNTTDSAVRITHLPTGLTAVSQNERSQLQNRDGALKVLKSKLTLLAKQKKVAALSELKGEPISAEWGSQIRSYVLHPYTLVKDVRTQYETADAVSVLNGEIAEFVEAYLRKAISDL